MLKTNIKTGLIASIVFICTIATKPVFAQDNNKLFERDSTLDISGLFAVKDTIVIKQKKPKKRVFWGYKTKRAYTRTYGSKVTTELFYVLKKQVEPDPFVGEIYWFDYVNGKISTKKITEKEKTYAKILHGPYKKMVDEDVVEEGFFYLGTKHGRWEKYDRNYILLDKVKYYRGWPKESIFEFYDREGKKLKEVTPIIHDIKQGKYMRFYESGNVAEEGYYLDDVKVGLWTEWFDNKGWRKKLTRYPDEPTADAEGKLVREWDNKGKILVDNEKETNKKPGQKKALQPKKQ